MKLNKIFSLLLGLTMLSPCNFVTANPLESYYSRSALLEKLPASLHSCIPVEIAKAKVQSVMELGNNEYYYLIGLVPEDALINVIFHLKDDVCQQISPLSNSWELSLLSYASENVVVPLIQGWYELLAAELGGLEVLKQELLEYMEASHNEEYVPLEDLLALEQLGIHYSDDQTNIFIVTPDGVYPLPEFKKQ